MVNVYLHQSIISELWAGQCWCGSQETRVSHFFYSLSNGQYQGSVHEGHDNVRIKFICKETVLRCVMEEYIF